MYERARDYSESALSAIGLQPRRTATDYILPALGLVGFGVLVGIGLGLILAPKAGVELRADIGRRVRRVSSKREQDATSDQEAEDVDVLSAVPTAR